jgi:AcrR family transcriptional regulator
MMQAKARINTKLSARKKPSQPRSQKMVKGILDATRSLLKQSGDLKLSRITTNHIAREAGISVGSLYQYFPNKEAILFELYKEMLGQFSSVLEEFKTEASLSLPREVFFDRFIRAMKGAESEVKVVFEMHNAMKIYPMLAEADRHHAEQIATEMANFMKHFGSKWSMKKLQRLALYVYYINYGTWMYRDHVSPSYQEVNDWEISALNFMIEKCFT